MKRNRFLVAAATIGMIAASGAAYAQQERQNQGGSGVRNEGGAAQQNRGRGETTGQGQLQNRDRDRTGQVQQNRGRGETTGQGQLQNRDRDQSGQAQQNRGRGETTGQGQLQNRDRDHRDQSGQAQQNRRRNETTGQAPQNERRDQNRVLEERRLDQNRSNERATIEQRDNRTTTGQGAAGSRANITVEQRTRVHEVIVKERSAPRLNSANFDVRVGTRIPRTVRFAPLPASIIEFVPVWRGYDYFWVGEEIVIVDPRTLEIVAVIEA
jgi:hypothetical protein